MSVAVLIMGMHRSGTSATAGALRLAGVDLGNNLTPGREENPRGSFEHDDVWQLHQRLLRELGSEWDDIRALPPQWPESDAARLTGEQLFNVLSKDFAASSLWGVKDPRLSRLFPVWPGILQRLSAEPRIVLALRHPLESARSIVKRDRLDPFHALAFWLRYTLDAERATRGYCRVVQHYPDLLSDWRAELSRIDHALDLGLGEVSGERERQVGSFLEADLRHHRGAEDCPPRDCRAPLTEWCEKVYRAMLGLPDEEALAVIDQVAASLAELEARALPFCAQVGDYVGQNTRLRWAIDRLESERGHLGSEVEHLEKQHGELSDRAREQELHAERAERERRQRDADLLVSRDRAEALQGQVRELRSRLAEAEAGRVEAQKAHLEVQSALHAVYQSRSWRVTRPLRAAFRRARRLRSGPGRSSQAGGAGAFGEPTGPGSGEAAPPPAAGAESARAPVAELEPGQASDLLSAALPGALRILIATPELEGPNRNGGIGTAFSELARWLRLRGHQVVVLYTRGRGSDAEPFEHWERHYCGQGVELIPLPEDCGAYIDAPGSVQLSWRVHTWLRERERNYDLVIFPEWTGIGYFVALARNQGLGYAGLRILVNTHGPLTWVLESNHMLPDDAGFLDLDFMERESVRRADWVISPSQYMLDWMRQHKWVLPTRSLVIPNLMAGGTEPCAAERLMHEVADVVFFGRLETRKGLGLFCDAIDRIPQERRSRIRQIAFLGRPAVWNGFDPLSLIEQRRKSWGVPSAVRSDLNREQAMAAMAASGSLAVVPSLSENSPYTVVECLRHGVPFIAASVGGIPELLDPADRATALFEPNPGALASRLAEVLQKGARPARPAMTQGEVECLWSSWLDEVIAGSAAADLPATPSLPSAASVPAQPKVSVCLVHHERPSLLAQALDSLRGQTYRDFEVVLVDDGSTSKEAVEYLESLEAEFELRDWRIVRQPNRYLGAARNRAAEAASGDYFLFMDDDNLAMRHEIETFVKVALRTGADVLTSPSCLFEGDEPPQRPDRLWLPLGGALGAGIYRNVFGDANAFWKREAFLAAGGYTTDYGVGYEDWELFSEAVLRGFRLELVPEPLFYYRVAPGSMMRSGDPWADQARRTRAFLRNDPSGLGLACAHAAALLLKRTEQRPEPVPEVHAAEVSEAPVARHTEVQGTRRLVNAFRLGLDPAYWNKFVLVLTKHGPVETFRRGVSRTRVIPHPRS